MTSLGKTIITAGILLFTLGSIAWILTQNWQWFAAGLSVFIGSVLTGAILSVETKQTTTRNSNTLYTNNELREPPYNNENDSWRQPSTPPPDHDPFTS
jgi:hypothetical protein